MYSFYLFISHYRKKELNEILDLIPGTTEFRMRQLEESARNVSLVQKIPECPVSKLQFYFLKLKFIITEGLP